MINFVCNLLGVTFSSLDNSIQLVIVVSSCCLICFFCDTIIRCIVSPIFRLLGGSK